MPKKKVFLSYAREDSSAADRLRKDLRVHGISVWFDKKDLRGGENWREVIHREISRADYFIALLSKSSVGKRGVVQAEIKKAIEVLEETPGDEIYLIPVRLMECKPKYRKLNELHWIDLFPRWEDGVNQIIRSIDGEQGHADLSKTPTPLDDIVIERDENAKPKRLKTLVHLSEMVRETIEIFGKYARRRNVIIDFTDTAPNAHVIASRPEIITAIANVLNNAIKYSYSGRNLESKVMLSTSQARSKAIIQIENWGVGIPKQDIESGVIFERGFRTPDAKEHTAGGMGMGLWLAREISRKYKGDIVVESKPVRWMIGEGDPRPPYVTTVRLIYPAEKIE